jgi:hypothetical protein
MSSLEKVRRSSEVTDSPAVGPTIHEGAVMFEAGEQISKVLDAVPK